MVNAFPAIGSYVFLTKDTPCYKYPTLKDWGNGHVVKCGWQETTLSYTCVKKKVLGIGYATGLRRNTERMHVGFISAYINISDDHNQTRVWLRDIGDQTENELLYAIYEQEQFSAGNPLFAYLGRQSSSKR